MTTKGMLLVAVALSTGPATAAAPEGEYCRVGNTKVARYDAGLAEECPPHREQEEPDAEALPAPAEKKTPR